MRSGFMVSLEFLNRSEVLAQSEALLGAWLRLAAFCSAQFNGGRIVDCRGWNKDQWPRMTRLSRQQITALGAAQLVLWEGDDLVVQGYDHEGDAIWAKKSRGGILGNQRKKAKREAERSALYQPSYNQGPVPDSVTGLLDRRASPDSEHGLRARTPSTDSDTAEQSIAMQERESEARARAHEVSDQGEDPEEQFIAKLRSLFLDTSSKAVTEWHELARQARIETCAEEMAFVCWAVKSARKQGGTVEYARHVIAAAQAWRHGPRQRWLERFEVEPVPYPVAAP